MDKEQLSKLLQRHKTQKHILECMIAQLGNYIITNDIIFMQNYKSYLPQYRDTLLTQPDLLGTTTELNPEIGNHSMGISAGHDNKTYFMDEKFDLGKEIYNMCNNYNKLITNMPNIIG